jgi:F-type H+-transporting ATPase subunit delta
MLVNDRIGALGSTITLFSQLVEQFMKVLSLEVTSAFALSDEEKRTLQSDIQKLVPAQYASLVSIAWHEDKNLIGGMIVKSGDRVLDGSLSGALERVGRAVN